MFFSRLILLVEKHYILHSNQFGFKKNNSTTVARVLSSLLNKCKVNKNVVLTILDLKKAFDFINHDLLLIELKHYGIRVLCCIGCAVIFRKERQKLNNSFSTVQSNSAGVPQGSLIAPILLNLFY